MSADTIQTIGGQVGTDIELAIAGFLLLGDGRPAERALNRIITTLYPPIRVWAARAAQRLGAGRLGQDIRDELAQLMAIEIASVLARARTAAAPRTVDSWASYLHAAAQHTALHYIQSPAFTGVPRSTGRERRARRLARTRNELSVSLQRTPTVAEVLQAHNAGALERRGITGASKSGELATLDEARAVMRAA